MGRLAAYLFGRPGGAELTAAAKTPPAPTAAATGPGEPSSMAELTRPTRAEALQVPAVVRARNLIGGTIAAMPLRAYRRMAGITEEVDPPAWAVQPDPDYTSAHVVAATIADLAFDARAYWRVRARNAAGWPTAFEYIDLIRVGYWRAPSTPWSAMVPSAAGGGWVLTIDGVPQPDGAVVRFDGIGGAGILTEGARELRTALALSDAARRFAAVEIPAGLLLDKGSGLATTTEIDSLLTEWESARRRHTTAYLAPGMEYAGDASLDPVRLQLIEARQQSAVEVARLFGLPAAYIEAPSGDSLTYRTVEGQRRDLVDISLAPYINAYEQRLSMPDVTPRGTTLRLDVEGFARGTNLDRWQSYEIAVRIGALSPEEVRARETFTPAGTVASMPPASGDALRETTPAPAAAA